MKVVFLLFTAVFLLVLPIHQVFAQEVSEGLATFVDVPDKNAQDGDIISSSTDGFALSKEAYDPFIYGVISDNPALSIQDTTLANGRAVISTGKTRVRISSKNGTIKKGDFITSSNTPGVGQKADRTGYILGLAIEDYQNADANSIGKILVSLNVGAANPNVTAKESLLEVFKTGIDAPRATPLQAFRYLLAALIIIISFVLGFIFFGRAAGTGVESLGRNPMAAKFITLGIVLHIVGTIGIMAVGVGIAYLILSL